MLDLYHFHKANRIKRTKRWNNKGKKTRHILRCSRTRVKQSDFSSDHISCEFQGQIAPTHTCEFYIKLYGHVVKFYFLVWINWIRCSCSALIKFIWIWFLNNNKIIWFTLWYESPNMGGIQTLFQNKHIQHKREKNERTLFSLLISVKANCVELF